MAFPLIIRICHWQKRLFVLCSFSPFSFRVTFFEEKRSFSCCLQLPPIPVQSLAITRIFGIDFFAVLAASGFSRSLKIPRRNNRAGSSPATGTSSETPLTARIPALRRGFLARRGVSSLLHRDRFAGSRCRVTMFAFRASAPIPTAKVILRSNPQSLCWIAGLFLYKKQALLLCKSACFVQSQSGQRRSS